MITQLAIDYAKTLFSLRINENSIEQTKQIFKENSILIKTLDNPMIEKKEKEAVIEAVFVKEIRNFLKVVCENQCIDIINYIFEAYETLELSSKNMIKAYLTYVIRPEEEELVNIKEMICAKYNKTGVCLEMKEDTSLIGGYILKIEDTEFDKSMKGALAEMKKSLLFSHVA